MTLILMEVLNLESKVDLTQTIIVTDIRPEPAEDTADPDSRFEEYRQFTRSYYKNYVLS